MISFGTDGWRAVMAEEFTFANLRLVVQAIAQYVVSEGLANRGILVGYDNRFLSEQLAAAAAEVLAGNGIIVDFPSRSVPTPVLAYTAVKRGMGGAVMLTASHNPPQYNGIKFIPEYGGPAMPAITDKIEQELALVQADGHVRQIPMCDARQRGLVREIDPVQPYLEHLEEIIDFEVIRRARLQVIVDPLYGAGIGYLEQVLRKAGCNVQVIHAYRDPLFGGGMPEPSGEMLAQLQQRVRSNPSVCLGLALDGDADRFGIVDADGEYYQPNQVLAVLFYHLLVRRQWRGPVARTVATTHLLDRIAAAFGQAVEETPVGFKYIGQSLMEQGCILGGEESGGLSIRGHVPEKDGILAAALVTEAVAASGQSISQMLDEIYNKYGTVVSRRWDLPFPGSAREQLLKRLQDFRPHLLGGEVVTHRLDIDGVKLVLADGSWVLIRPSGTEPVVRMYIETGIQDRLQLLQREVAQALQL